MPPSLVGPRFRFYVATFLLFLSLASLFYLFQDSLNTLRGVGGNSSTFDAQSQTALEHDPPPDKPPYGAVVVAAQPETDLIWTMFVQDWKMYAYDVTQPNNTDPRLRFPQSTGNEAMIYLSYIIDNYDDLPWCALFVHGHLNPTWHQEDNLLRIIRALNRVALARQGYMSLRCDWGPSCPMELIPTRREPIYWGPEAQTQNTEAALHDNWRFIFPEDPVPEALASPCCAQFAVTRQAIIRRPKSDYERIRFWLVNTLLEDTISGRVLEKLWAYLFLGETLHCPDPRMCHCEWFGRCVERNWTEAYNGFEPEKETLPT